nr:uncharacterized protein LOC117220349 [Megalopta genalis]
MPSPGINHSTRSNEEYATCSDDDNCKDNQSPLVLIPIGVVSQVIFEYMHLVCLGVIKKDVKNIVHPGLLDFAKIEISVVTYGVLNDSLHQHFLMLLHSIKTLFAPAFLSRCFEVAEVALEQFVAFCEKLYGPNFSSYNVHGLLHLVNDAKRFDTIESFSAFLYESNMSTFRKYCRKTGKPLQQFSYRMIEIEHYGSNMGGGDYNNHPRCSVSMMFRNRSGEVFCHKLQLHAILLDIGEYPASLLFTLADLLS